MMPIIRLWRKRPQLSRCKGSALLGGVLVFYLFAGCRNEPKNAQLSTSQSRTQVASSALGCYRASVLLSTSVQVNAASDSPRAGMLIRLDSAMLSTRFAERKQLTILNHDSSFFPVRFWTADSQSDSVRLTIGNGHAGYHIVVSSKATTAQGYVIPFTEVAREGEALAPASLSRVACAMVQDE